MKNKSPIYRIINGKDENRRLDRRYVFLGLFIFAMVATISFFYTRGMDGANAVNLSGFKAGNIMSDAVMRNYTSMTESEIQSFLNAKVSCNKSASGGKSISAKTQNGVKYNYQATYSGTTYYYHVENGKYVCMNTEKFDGETAAHIIYQAARDYKINPQVLIVLLQKEQGLITDKWPNVNHQYRSATGYGCPDTAACDSKYYGFKNQVRQAANLFDIVLSGKSSYYPIKKNNQVRYSPKASCGSSTVYIENYATSALYRYTPYQPNAAALRAGYGTGDGCSAYGNRNFYAYFTDWFGSTQVVTPKTASITFSENSVFSFKTSDGKYLVPKENKSGAEIVISASADESSRTYKFVKNGNFYNIIHIKTGLAVDLKNADINEGTLQLYTKDNSDAQKWRISENGSSYIIHTALLDNLVLDTSDGLSLEFSSGVKTQNITFVDSSEAPVKNDTYLFETTGGKAMDLFDAKTTNGTRVNIYNIAYNNNQLYKVTRRDDGFYTLINLASNKAMDVASASTANGAAIQVYDANGSCAQKWIIEKSGVGHRLLSACSGKAVDVPSANVSTNNMKLQLYDANGTNAQVWKLQSLTLKKEAEEKAKAEAAARAAEAAARAAAEAAENAKNATQLISDGTYVIYSSVGSNFVLDVYGSTAKNAKNGTNIQIYQYINSNTQKFKVTYNASKDLYYIVNPTANRSIDVSGASMRNYSNIQLYTINNTCAQLWKITKNSDNTFTIKSSCSNNFVLDVSGASARNRANVQLYASNGTKAQKWTFKKI